MTRFLAAQMAKSHYFDLSAARRLLGYRPAVSTAEGVNRLVAALAARRGRQRRHGVTAARDIAITDAQLAIWAIQKLDPHADLCAATTP